MERNIFSVTPGSENRLGLSAAVYSQIGAIGSFSLKPVSGPLAQAEPQAGVTDLYDNQDAAGTPEAYKQFVVCRCNGRRRPELCRHA